MRVAKLEVMQCPYCKANALKVVATLAGCRQLPVLGHNVPINVGV